MGKIRKWKPALQTKEKGTATKSNPQLSRSWEQRTKERAEREAVLKAQREADELIRAEKRAEREEREEREKRKAENKEKGQQYQVISDTSKIKKMSKKQLRLIKKADTSGVAPKVYVTKK